MTCRPSITIFEGCKLSLSIGGLKISPRGSLTYSLARVLECSIICRRGLLDGITTSGMDSDTEKVSDGEVDLVVGTCVGLREDPLNAVLLLSPEATASRRLMLFEASGVRMVD